MADLRIALIGFGRLGQIVAAQIDRAVAAVGAFDSAFAWPGSAPGGALRRCAIDEFASARGAAAEAQLVVAAVPAAAVLEAARAIACAIEPDAFFLDLSGAAGRRRADAEASVTRAGGRYVAGAYGRTVGTPPLLMLRGRHAPPLARLLRRLGMAAEPVPIDYERGADRNILPFARPHRPAARIHRAAAHANGLARELIA